MENSHQVEEPSAETLAFQTSEKPIPKSEASSFCLIVMAGPEKGATYSLRSGTWTIGRSSVCDIVVSGRGVSRVHAEITLKPSGVAYLKDNNSTNGVFVDGQAISLTEIERGQTLGFGPEVQLHLELSSGGVQNLLKEMYQSATVDSLTGLYSRRAFEERLDEEFAVVRRHAMHSCLAVLDLDHFKAVNDDHGHEVGDLVLRALAQHLKEGVRTGDLVGRWGGEEFVMYIRQSVLEGGVMLLNRLRTEISDMDISLPDGKTIRITLSAGIVDLLDFSKWRDAFSCADKALYEAKAQGRNCVVPGIPGV